MSAIDPARRALQQLFAVPPTAFVRERDATAAALTRAGHTTEARSVRRLRKPSAMLWATNQLARTDPTRLAAFLHSVDHVRTAQLRDPLAAAAALRRQRAELDALVQRASALLATQGWHPTAQMRQRISSTLLGAAVERRLATELRQGRLSAELTAPGFEVLAGVPRASRLQLVPPRQTAPASKPDGSDTVRKAEATERARRQQEADRLGREAAARQEAANRLAREVGDLARRLAAVRERLRAARRAATIAAAAARKARRARR